MEGPQLADKLQFLQQFKLWMAVVLILALIFREKVENFFTLKRNIRQKLYQAREPIFTETSYRCLSFKHEIFSFFNKEYSDEETFMHEYEKLADDLTDLENYVNRNHVYYPIDILEHLRNILTEFNQMVMDCRSILIERHPRAKPKEQVLSDYNTRIEDQFDNLNVIIRYLLQSDDVAMSNKLKAFFIDSYRSIMGK